MRLPRLAVLLGVALLAVLLPALAHAQNLTTDTPTAPYHGVVHLYASAAPAGTLTFADNGNPITTINVTPQGTAVLSDAILTPGTHILTAGASNPVSVTILPAPSTFQFSVDNALVFEHYPLYFAMTGLPPKATGTITYAQDGVPFNTVNYQPNPAAPAYQAFGDSITIGFTLNNQANRYADLFAAANGLTSYLNYADSGAAACDLLTQYILPNQLDPTQDNSPLNSLMIGATDMDNFGTPTGEPNYITCHRAALAWLGIPREFKILPGDPALTVLSGSWALPPAQLDATYQTLYNSSGTGAASFQITSNGGPLYLWYLLGDHLAGSFTVTLDGTPTGTTYFTNPTNPIASRKNPDSTGFALLKLPVDPGPHTLRVDVLSGTVGLLAAATPPSPGNTSVHPTILSTDVTNQDILRPVATQAEILQYSADALADATGLQSDGLDIRTVPTHNFLGTSDPEFDDYAHPSILGHQELAQAFQAVFGNSSTYPYLVVPAAIPRQAFYPNTLGTHTYTATYSGDSIYAPSSGSVTVQVVPEYQSVTSLSAPATTLPAGHPFLASAVIYPANPGAAVMLMEGPQVLATATVASNTANFALPSLAPGMHTLYAAYAGVPPFAASVSPPLLIQVLANPTTLTLTTSAAELAYPAGITLAVAVEPATATGTVTFNDSYTPAGQASAQTSQPVGQATLISSGTATFTLSSLLPGTHTLTATYSGDLNDSPATSTPVATVIDRSATSTLLTGTPAAYGSPSSFTATVSPAGAPGTVTFTDLVSATSVQLPLLNGTATWNPQTLLPGLHNLIASYAGDATHAPSTSTVLSATIARATSTLALNVPVTAYVGTPVTFTTSVSPASATGTVLFSDATAGTLGQATVAGGLATLTLPSLPAAAYVITATYSGDTNTLPAASTPAPFHVLSKATTTTLTAPATSSFGTSVMLSASVAPAPAAGGLLRFADNGNPLGSVALTSGVASLNVTSLTSGSHTLTATFAGDSSLDASTGSATLTITPASSTTALTLSQPTVLAGSPASFTVRVASAAPTGTVTLRTGSTTLATATLANPSAGAAYATFTVPTPAPGTFPVAAFYSGDANTAPSDSSAGPLTYTVNPRVASGTLTLSATQVPPLTPVILTAAFTSPATSGPALIPTGSVTFASGQSILATVALDASGNATATLSPTALGTLTLTAVYTPSGVFSSASIAPQTLTVTAPLALAFSNPTITLAPAASADASLTLTPLSGFQGVVALQCSSPESYLTCTVDEPGTVNSTVAVKVHLSAAASSAAVVFPRGSVLLLALLLPFTLLLRKRRLPSVLLLLFAAMVNLTGCAQGGSFNSAPSGTYLVQLTATAANTPTTTTLTVHIQ